MTPPVERVVANTPDRISDIQACKALKFKVEYGSIFQKSFDLIGPDMERVWLDYLTASAATKREKAEPLDAGLEDLLNKFPSNQLRLLGYATEIVLSPNESEYRTFPVFLLPQSKNVTGQGVDSDSRQRQAVMVLQSSEHGGPVATKPFPVAWTEEGRLEKLEPEILVDEGGGVTLRSYVYSPYDELGGNPELLSVVGTPIDPQTCYGFFPVELIKGLGVGTETEFYKRIKTDPYGDPFTEKLKLAGDFLKGFNRIVTEGISSMFPEVLDNYLGANFN